jgi:hypothetical protein
MDALQELRRSNPRNDPSFADSVRSADALRTRTVSTDAASIRAGSAHGRSARAAGRHRRPVRVGAMVAGTAAVAVAVAAFLVGGSPGGGGLRSASAAVRHAAATTSEAGTDSGTAVVSITHDGEAWAGKTVAWHGDDISITEGVGRGRAMLVVDGVLYGYEEPIGWLAMGDPSSIDPDSGTTPDEYRAATLQDTDGTTLRRITDAITGLTTTPGDDGSTVYSGSVAAGEIATEAGTKGSEPLRVFPWGYVAHDAAADPGAMLDIAVTVDADGVISRIAVHWGTDASSWRYTVIYRDLGSTPAITAPEHARSLLELRDLGDA